MTSGWPDYWIKGKLIELIERVALIDEITLIDTISTVAGITNISNIASVDLIDLIAEITELKTIRRILQIDEIGSITEITEPIKIVGTDVYLSTASYTFVGVTRPSASHKAKLHTSQDTETKDEGTEIDQSEYDEIEASDDDYWEEALTAGAIRYAFKIDESPDDITELKITWEGYCSQSGLMHIIRIWDNIDEEYVYLGGYAGSESTEVMTIKTNISRYVDADGYVWIYHNAYATEYIDYVKLDVTSYSPTPVTDIPVNLTKVGGTTLTSADIVAYFAHLDIDLSSLRDAITDASAPKDLKDLYDELVVIDGHVDGLETQLDITLSSLRDAITDGTTPKDLKDIYDELVTIKGHVDTLETLLAEPADRNITQITGTALTGRDWSSDFANLDIALSTLRDAIVDGTTPKDLKDLYDQLVAIQGHINQHKQLTSLIYTLLTAGIKTTEQSPLSTIEATQSTASDLKVEIVQPSSKENFQVETGYDEGEATGTTTNSYAVPKDWDCRKLGNKTLAIKNTGGSNSLTYTGYKYPSYDANIAEIITEAVLAAGEQFILKETDYWARIKIYVKSTSGGSHTTYEVSYGGIKLTY